MNYSVFSLDPKKSFGRVFSEKEDLNRTCFMRDRDRIIHSSAFRRLKYKTQVFIYHEGDYYRTRLSHSLEVSQLARSISKIFSVNDDLAESISLAHDLGHTPFGHAGEEALNEKMKSYGGFNHNIQALKILTLLEKKYINFDGLNLTWESFEGILKHNGAIKNKSQLPKFITKIVDIFNGDFKKNPSFEAQISSISDDIAYNNNDIDDGLHAKLFCIEELETLQLVKENLNKIEIRKSEKLYKKERIKHELVRMLIKDMVDDLVLTTRNNLRKIKPKSFHDIQLLNKNIVSFSSEMKKKEQELRNFLKKKMYEHMTVRIMTYKAKKIVSDLFDLFVSENGLLPSEEKLIKNKKELYLSISDYISSMTDKNAINIHNKFFNLYNF